MEQSWVARTTDAAREVETDPPVRRHTVLRVGGVHDPEEAEADRIADDVLRILASAPVAATSAHAGEGRIARVAGPPTLPAAVGPDGGELDADVANRIRRAAGGGAPLEPQLLSSMEEGFGTSLQGVRIHRASPLAPEVGAVAFTLGSDVHFAPGAYAPDQPEGLRVLSHELAHVVQQGGAARRTVIRRLPTRVAVENAMGKPKKDRGIGKLKKRNSTKYRSVLDALDAVHALQLAALQATAVGIKAQLADLLTRYNTLITACSAYEGDVPAAEVEPGQETTKAQYARNLKLQAQNEKTMVIGPMMREAGNPGRWLGRGFNRQPAIQTVLASAADPLGMNEAQHQGQVGGGMSKLEHYSPGGVGGDKYFKPNMATLDVFADMNEELAAGANITDAQSLKDFTGKQNRTDFADKGGIDASDSRTAAREVASYRLDQLLDAGMIARTQFALRTAGNVTTLGSVQRAARGRANANLKAARDTADQQAIGGNDVYRTDDPDYLRLMSRISLLDTLAFQLDRHAGNYYIDIQGGQVVSITGIDNDMSFGTKTGVGQLTKAYSGMSRWVDAELAQSILAIDVNLLELALDDLLTPAELTAIKTRLLALQAHLNLGTTNLLTRAQWTTAVAQNMFQEKRSYQAQDIDRANQGQRGY